MKRRRRQKSANCGKPGSSHKPASPDFTTPRQMVFEWIWNKFPDKHKPGDDSEMTRIPSVKQAVERRFQFLLKKFTLMQLDVAVLSCCVLLLLGGLSARYSEKIYKYIANIQQYSQKPETATISPSTPASASGSIANISVQEHSPLKTATDISGWTGYCQVGWFYQSKYFNRNLQLDSYPKSGDEVCIDHRSGSEFMDSLKGTVLGIIEPTAKLKIEEVIVDDTGHVWARVTVLQGLALNPPPQLSA
jgi:hypothetical protein